MTLPVKTKRRVFDDTSDRSQIFWGLYLVLLLLHWRFAQNGRRFAWGAVGGFAFILLTFWGSNLLSNIHH